MCYKTFMAKAIFPGSFDPPINGHINIIDRSAKLFEWVDVVIAENEEKKCLFSKEERIAFLQKIIAPYKNVSINVSSEKLLVNYAKKSGASVMLRGVRNITDFSYEFDLFLMNKSIECSIETLFIPSELDHIITKSSAIKTLFSLGGDVSKFVPDFIEKALREKMR